MKRAEARSVFSTTVHVPITDTRTKRIQSRHKIPRSTQLYVKLDVSGILILLFFSQITFRGSHWSETNNLKTGKLKAKRF